jgi:hypothetical protein
VNRDEQVATFLARLDRVEDRLRIHSAAGRYAGLTDPDLGTGEQWDVGQVWAHLAEILPYWMGEVRGLVARASPEPVPFGRVKSDPGRIRSIEAGRVELPPAQMSRVATAIDELRDLLRSLPPPAWDRRGRHETLGDMSLPEIFEEFLVGHLEEHADQLDGLAAHAATTP